MTDAPVQADPALALLTSWGLEAGLELGGWALKGLRRQPRPALMVARFGRDTTEVEVMFRCASDEPRFSRVGAVDLFHGPVPAEVSRDVGELLRAVGNWVQPRDTAALAAALTSVAPAAPAPSAPVQQAYDAAEAPPLDPAKRASPDRPFMRFETIELSQLPRYRNALREMYEGTLGGLVIKNVYDKAAMARIVEVLAADGTHFPRHSFPARFKAHFLGRALDGSDPRLEEYLQDAQRFREESRTLFEATTPFEARMEELFGAMAGGRSVAVPRFTDGRVYTPATIRILLEGGQIGTHCGNEANTRPAYTHLNGLVDRADQLSYFLTLQEPEQGGGLIVYSLKWSDIDRSHIVDGRSQVESLLGQAQWLEVRPTAGDLLIFDGGRYFHRVDVVRGPRLRWTMGGFMMFDRAGTQLLYWS